MQYRLVSLLAAGIFAASINAAPVPNADSTTGQPEDSFHLGKPKTVVTWGRDVAEKPQDNFHLGTPSTVVTWGKRDNPDIIQIGKPDSKTTWGKRDEQPADEIDLTPPTTEIGWGKN